MAQLYDRLFGGSKNPPSPVPAAVGDVDNAPSPTPIVNPSVGGIAAPGETASPGVSLLSDRPYTKWYNIHERTSPSDFYLEMILVPIVLFSILMHFWGVKRNRSTARRWMDAIKPVLEAEYAQVGVRSKSEASSLSEDDIFHEQSKHTFLTYATGRQNAAFLDVKLQLYKRENLIALLGETIVGFLFESWPMPEEKLELVVRAFDGQEAQYVLKPEEREKRDNSAYDGFVWAIIHKDYMKQLRDDRYDLSITSTKEHAKLPAWATVMSESAEITDTLLTPDLIKAVETCGESLEALIVTDLPEEAPKSLQDLSPKKRIVLSLNLGRGPEETLPLVEAFLRIPDHLVSTAHFRPEVMRRVKTTREETIARIRKGEDESKAEGRKTEADKHRKEERERKLKAMTPTEQRKFLEKERERENKKKQGKRMIKA